jgi:hypothetical protein
VQRKSLTVGGLVYDINLCGTGENTAVVGDRFVTYHTTKSKGTTVGAFIVYHSLNRQEHHHGLLFYCRLQQWEGVDRHRMAWDNGRSAVRKSDSKHREDGCGRGVLRVFMSEPVDDCRRAAV